MSAEREGAGDEVHRARVEPAGAERRPHLLEAAPDVLGAHKREVGLGEEVERHRVLGTRAEDQRPGLGDAEFSACQRRRLLEPPGPDAALDRPPVEVEDGVGAGADGGRQIAPAQLLGERRGKSVERGEPRDGRIHGLGLGDELGDGLLARKPGLGRHRRAHRVLAQPRLHGGAVAAPRRAPQPRQDALARRHPRCPPAAPAPARARQRPWKVRPSGAGKSR